ncbi:TIGR03943 family protein [Clostridium carnis]
MKRFNLEELFKFLILLGFTFYFYYLLITNKLNLFVSPRIIKYTIFTSILFSILSIYQFTKIFTIKRRNTKNFEYILMCLTLIIGFYAVQAALTSNISDNKDLNNNFAVSYNKNSSTNKQQVENLDTIIFTDENYLKTLANISGENREKYKEQKVVIDGFIYKHDTLKKDEFVISRLMMSCCAADSQIVGLISKYSEASTLRKDDWFRVEGTLDFEDNNPILLVNKLTSISKPENFYVYPNF